jgi:hypothetical protein
MSCSLLATALQGEVVLAKYPLIAVHYLLWHGFHYGMLLWSCIACAFQKLMVLEEPKG